MWGILKGLKEIREIPVPQVHKERKGQLGQPAHRGQKEILEQPAHKDQKEILEQPAPQVQQGPRVQPVQGEASGIMGQA